METRTLTPYIVVAALMVLTSLALAFTVDVAMVDTAGIRASLPDRVGAWTGHEIRFCQNPSCRKEFAVEELVDPEVCPDCGSGLYTMTPAERQLLPADTVILKKRYFHPDGQDLFVTVVFSGKERVSIHRPQICLAGQGRRIQGESIVKVPVDGRNPLNVMVLDLAYRVTAPDGRPYEYSSYYAYWFVGKDRETPYHLERMFWMGIDRVFRNVAHKWAYIAIGGARNTEAQTYKDQIRDFVHDFYPQILLN